MPKDIQHYREVVDKVSRQLYAMNKGDILTPAERRILDGLEKVFDGDAAKYFSPKLLQSIQTPGTDGIKQTETN